MGNKKKKTGKKGESKAIKFLKEKGLELIERNFCIWGGEIDLIMKENEIFVFVEVKTRKTETVEVGQLISAKQKRTLIKTSQIWLQKNGLYEVDSRIDVIGVLYEDNENIKIEWIKNAIY